MKQRLFWKILVGFWITIFVITQGVWVIFALLSKPVEGSDLFDLSRYALIVANSSVRSIPRAYIALTALGGLIFSASLAWYLTRPMTQLRLGFGELARGKFSTRLGPGVSRRRDEIADLMREFDSMAERLEEMIKARDILLATVSHELRSPLARLQLAIGLARQDPSKLESSLDRIGHEAARLEEMVDELLTLSQLESGISQVDEYFELSEVLRIVCDDAKFEATPSGIEVAVDIARPADLDEWICRGSGKLISRAIENIVRNALRFSQKGQVVNVSLKRADNKYFRLDVIDEGPGAPPQILKSLFQPFMHRDKESGEGFGLGLSIAQRAIVAHGGSISAHNREGQGFAVTALLPASNYHEGVLLCVVKTIGTVEGVV